MGQYLSWIPVLVVFGLVVAFYHRSVRQAREGKGWMAEYGRRHAANFWAEALQPGETVTAGALCTLRESTLAGYPSAPYAEYLMVGVTDRGRVLFSGYSQSRCRDVRSYPRASVVVVGVAREAHDPLLKLSPLYWLFGRDQFNCTCTLVLPDATMRLLVPSGEALLAALGVDPRGVPDADADAATEPRAPELAQELQQRLRGVRVQADPIEPRVAHAGRPLLFLYERDPRAILIGGESASFALYESGLVVYAHDAPEAPYRAVCLDAPERDALLRDLALDALADVPPRCSAIPPGVSAHPPYIELLVAWGASWRSIRVEPATRARCEHAPPPVRRILERVARFDDPRARPWLPPTVEAVLWPFEHARLEPVPWPDAWPAPGGGGSDTQRVFIESRYHPVLSWLVESLQSRQPVSARGRRWSVALRVPLPGEVGAREG